MLAGSLFATAQNPDSLMAEFAEKKNVQHQIIDKETLNKSLENRMVQDSTGEMKSMLPPFMEKLDRVELVIVENGTPDDTEQMQAGLNALKDGNEYATIVKVKDNNDNVRIIAKKAGELISDIYIFVCDEKDIVLIKMSGEFDRSDLDEIVKEQTKNKK
jgi:hypothetical protein